MNPRLSDERTGKDSSIYESLTLDRPPCDKKSQSWIRENYGTGTGTPAAKARATRLDNMRRHAKWMARNDPT
jgi:hypothetical protein